MKRSIVYLLSMMAIFSLAGCEKPEETQKPGEDPTESSEFTLTATVKATDVASKTFAVGDEIAVLHVENGSTSFVADGKFTYDAAGFKGELGAKLDDAKKYDWFAQYPYAEVSSPAKAAIKYAEAQTQDGYNSDAHVAGLLAYAGVAKAVEAKTAPAVELNPLMAVVKVDVLNTDEDPIVISGLTFGTESMDIAGEFTMNYTGENVRYTAVKASKTVKLTVTGGTEIAKDQKASFYLTVKPSSLSGGEKISVTVESDKGNFFQAFDLTEAKELPAGAVTSFEIERAPVLIPELNVVTEKIVGIDAEHEYEIAVDCNVAWEASAEEEWIIFRVKNGAGQGKVVVVLTPFPGGAGRDGIITVKAGELEDKVYVEQGYGSLIGDLIWAKYDVADPGVFMTDMESPGKMYKWNSKVAWAGGNNPDATVPEGFETGEVTVPEEITAWQPENDPCPKGWHVPTTAQAKSLIGWGHDEDGHADGIAPAKNPFTWGWGYVTQGVFVGNADSVTAKVDDLKGNIFIPMSAYRNGDVGTITYTSSTFLQTAELTGSWMGPGRLYYQMHWNGKLYGYYGGANQAMPVRCVSEFAATK